MMDRTGVTIDFLNCSMESGSEKFNLLVTSGNYGDIIAGVAQFYTGGLTSALDGEIITDLYNYEEYIPNFLYVLDNDEDAKIQMLTDDGQLSGFHTIKLEEDPNQNGLVVRKDYLDAIGYDYSDISFGNFTYDDLNEILYALKDEYDLTNTLWMSSGLSLMKHLENGLETCAYTERAKVPVYTVDGVVQFGPVTEGFKTYLTMLHQWYEDGIISSDFASATSEPDTGDVLNGKVAMWYTAGSVVYTYMTSATDENFDLVYLPDPVSEDYQYVNTFYPRVQTTGYSITTTCSNPEVACQFFDYIYSPEGQLLSRYGEEGVTFNYDENGDPQFTDLITDNPDGLTATQAVTYYLMQACVTDFWDTSFSLTDYQLEAYDTWTDYDNDSTACAFPSCELNSEENELVAQTYTDMMTYYEMTAAQFVTGALDLDADWDSYIDTMYSYNLEEILAAYQACYDRYQERGIIENSK
jgi:putative aldouronate transport system substrate-binding protein